MFRQQAAGMLTLQFLAWVGERPRSYGEAMEAWRSTCPRLSIWENAVRDRLVEFESGAESTMRERRVTLSKRGRALLAGRARAAR